MADGPRGARAVAWRTWYRVKWRLWQRRQVDRVRIRTLRGLRVTVQPGVLDPAWFFSSEVLVDALALEVRPGDRVLDLGTGTGIGALAAARAGASAVVATDLDSLAVACARENVAEDARIEVRAGDGFDPVAGERFDVVAFNPPWLSVSDDQHAAALRVDAALPARFASGLADHLAPAGRAILVLSTTADTDAWLAPLRAAGFATHPIVVRDRGSEVLTAWRLTPPAA
jgi:release factor glutamine methyltransferase